MIPSAPITFWKYFDFISIGALAIIIGYLVTDHRKQTGSILGTISQTVAHNPKSSLFFSLGMTVFFPAYYAYLYFWLAPHVGAPNSYYYLLIVSAIFEMIFVWVPAREGVKNTIHSVAAGIVGIFMFTLPALILVEARTINEAAKFSIVAFLVTSCLLATSLAIKKYRKYTFGYETGYCLLFLICMAIVGHT